MSQGGPLPFSSSSSAARPALDPWIRTRAPIASRALALLTETPSRQAGTFVILRLAQVPTMAIMPRAMLEGQAMPADALYHGEAHQDVCTVQRRHQTHNAVLCHAEATRQDVLPVRLQQSPIDSLVHPMARSPVDSLVHPMLRSPVDSPCHPMPRSKNAAAAGTRAIITRSNPRVVIFMTTALS